jgi:4-hydroxybenzoate polyprenyltransferase
MMKNIVFKSKCVLGLVRPFTLLAPVVVSFSIIIASFFYNNVENLSNVFFFVILPACFSLAFLNGASNALNQATDKDADCISKPYRPIPKGLISVKEALILSIFLYLLSGVFALFVNITFTLFVLCITFFTITYSLPPRLKDKLWFNQLWIAIPRGILGILASWSVFGSVFEPLPLIIAFIAGLFLFGGSITKDISDKDADKLVGTKTLINIYGMNKAALFSLPFLFFPFLLIPLFINLGVIQYQFWLLTLLAIPGWYIFVLMVRNQKQIHLFENTTPWMLMYLTYFLFASTFSIITIATVF